MPPMPPIFFLLSKPTESAAESDSYPSLLGRENSEHGAGKITFAKLPSVSHTAKAS